MPIELKRPTRSRRSAGLLFGVGLAVCVVAGMALIVFLGDRVAASNPEPVVVANTPWQVDVDPGPEWGEFAIPDNALIRTSSSRVVYPTTPAPFVAVNPANDPTVWQVHGLKTWKPVGTPQKLDLPRFALPVLSPDGRFLAFKEAKTSMVELRPVRGGENVRIQVTGDSGMTVAMIDFASGGVPFIMKGRADVYEDIPGEWDVMGLQATKSTAVYQLDAANKPGKEFSAPPFHPTTAALTPGRNYLVMHQFDEKEGHQLVFRDLRTGKEAGALQVQDADNPRGHPAGLAFSRDGKQVALLWHLGDRSEHWGRLICWDVATGRKLLKHDIGYLVSSMELLWTHGGMKSIQWLPDGSGWLLFGHLILRREDGTVIRKIGPEPKTASEVAERLFLTRDQYTNFDSKTRTLTIRTLK